jgi:hypothetical protein
MELEEILTLLKIMAVLRLVVQIKLQLIPGLHSKIILEVTNLTPLIYIEENILEINLLGIILETIKFLLRSQFHPSNK